MLDDPAIASLDVSLTRELPQEVSDHTVLAQGMIDHLFDVDDPVIAQTLTRKAPELVIKRVLNTLASAARGEEREIKAAWLDASRRAASTANPPIGLEDVITFSELAAWARLLDYSVSLGLRLPTQQWANAVMRSADDLRGIGKDLLFAYLLVMALDRPRRGCEPLIETTFGVLNSGVAKGTISMRARQLLEGHLPPLAWWNQWDTSARLKHGVVNAFVYSALDVSSFYRLSEDKKITSQLIEVAEETKEGRNYLSRDTPRGK